MKDIKIIFFDIDGTLIAMDQDTISEKTLEALKRLQEKGVKLCLATGRGPMLIPHFEGVEFDAFLTYNGSYCYDHEVRRNDPPRCGASSQVLSGSHGNPRCRVVGEGLLCFQA